MALSRQELVLGFSFVQGSSTLCRLCGHDGEGQKGETSVEGKWSGFLVARWRLQDVWTVITCRCCCGGSWRWGIFTGQAVLASADFCVQGQTGEQKLQCASVYTSLETGESVGARATCDLVETGGLQTSSQARGKDS